LLRSSLRDLRQLHSEAAAILRKLSATIDATAVRRLCKLFDAIQELFAMRFVQAKRYALAALGALGAGFLPPMPE
jgi:hypothetical protein